ncbi:hypothetical protein [Novipirellula artificiosorum]|uniref:Uncharacterized protein n=1 Tax=Novipirellula artificiosorum TaxID=2528016 RepID=A0A5C6CTX9_9BACT|nr:hypothetical protein [Novipirellula artificiosorum]TWU27952.1 hypothetical protein Poly41_70260 [Novipirellula artificiosorum]
MRRRRIVILCAVALLSIACIAWRETIYHIYFAVNRSRVAASAPVATASSPSIAWTESQIIGWHYSLVSSSRVADFGFYETAATANIGGPPEDDLPHLGIKAGDESLMEVRMCGVFWSISPTGELLLAEPDSDYAVTLRLVYIDDRVASVWNATVSEPEVYVRSQ